jgi:fermentation-respiration switch protein FrsA (DUF1100 family)
MISRLSVLSSLVGIPQFIALAIVIGIGIAIGVDLYAGYLFVCPMRSVIGPPPADLGATAIAFPSASGATLRGWYAPGALGHGAVLLVHGIHADRGVMLPRARFLHRAGYSVLLFDLQAHGESTGDRITFGIKEGLDVESALGVLRQKAPGERVGVIAVSLGGAAALLGPHPLDVDALVLESVFPTIVEATRNRVGSFGTTLLLWQLRPRLGLSADDLRPIQHIRDVRAPIFVISGDADRHTTPADTRAMFDAANEPKNLWLVPGAAHEDLYAVAAQEYEQRILGFFRRSGVGGS